MLTGENDMRVLKTCFAFVGLLVSLGISQARADVASISSSGLRLIVSGFECGDLAFPGGTIKALPSREQYLVLNLRTLKLHTLLRAIGDGDLVLAQLTTDETNVTCISPVELVLPETRIPEFFEKREAGEPITVACFGTSLTENGNGTDGWLKLLFGKPSDEERERVFVEGDIVWKNHAVGGANARYTITLLGAAWYDGEELESPSLDCDLAIVGLLPNGGSNRLAVFESVVRKLYDSGTEILLVTDNAHAKDGEKDVLWTDGLFVRELADRYNCALADTAAYMLEAKLRGEDVYQDSIHQNGVGHYQWANSVASVLAPEATIAPANVLTKAGCSTLQPSVLVPEFVEVDFTPVREGGREERDVPQNRLAVFHGLSDGLRIDMGVGDLLEVYRLQMTDADIIFDASSSFSVEVRKAGDGAIVKRIRYRAPKGNPAWAVRPQTRSVFVSNKSGVSPDEGYELVVTSGTLRLYGVSYFVKPQ